MADDSFRAVVESRGYQTSVLETKYDDMGSETDRLIPVISRVSPKLILVDSYFVSHDYLQTIQKMAKVAYMDDVLSFAYPVDFLINYNIFSSLADYKNLYSISGVKRPKMFLGTRYAPLREEFRHIQFRRSENVDNIFISSGGADTEHVELQLVEWLMNHPGAFQDVVFHVVVGAVNQDADTIIQKSAHLNNVMIHRNVRDMKTLMLSCDMAVSAAGSTLYELCACGVPIVTYVIADNQVAAERAFVNKGIALSVGDIRNKQCFVEELTETIEALIHNCNLRIRLSDTARALVDGRGADVLVSELMEYL